MSVAQAFSIQAATAEDLRAVAEVHSRAVRAAYPDVIPPELFDPEFVAPARMELEYRDLLDSFGPQEALLKAVADSQIVGICTCGRDTELGDSETGYVQRVYVDPDWWSRGVGSALVNEALRLLTEVGYRRAALQVLENNKKARAFYEKRGWKLAGTVREKRIGRELRYTSPSS